MPEIVELGSEMGSGENSSKKILLGKYEIGKLLGRGAFAKVYHARNIENGQSVAIKEISKQKMIQKGMATNITREISIMSQLNHPYIIKLFEVLGTKTKIYLIMEFAKGGDLFDKITRFRRFNEDLSRQYFQQLISAVGYCHYQGVFHRDLKPENLLLDGRGHLKVTDFGLSTAIMPESDKIKNGAMLRTFCGTAAYVAPEMIGKNKSYDGAKTDIWSCGVILFVFNAGSLPFYDDNRMELYRKIFSGEYRCPKWMSSELCRFLSRLLDRNPVTRITIDEIVRDPWFKQGYKAIKFDEPSGKKQEENGSKFLNAFSIISFSPGLDLAGLFKENLMSESERFISAESAEGIIEKIEEVAMKENLDVKSKDMKLIIQGQKGKLLVGVEIYGLTESLVVVDVRSYEGVWKKKFKPKLDCLVYTPESANR